MPTELATEKAIRRALADLTDDQKRRLLDAAEKGAMLCTVLQPYTAGHCQLTKNIIREGVLDALERGLWTVADYDAWRERDDDEK